MTATNQRWDEAEIHRVRGVVLCELGRQEEGHEALRFALLVARKQGARLWMLRAATALATAPTTLHGKTKPYGELAAVVGQFEAEATALDLVRARILLNQAEEGVRA
jgi:hypothetical protein